MIKISWQLQPTGATVSLLRYCCFKAFRVYALLGFIRRRLSWIFAIVSDCTKCTISGNKLRFGFVSQFVHILCLIVRLLCSDLISAVISYCNKTCNVLHE